MPAITLLDSSIKGGQPLDLWRFDEFLLYYLTDLLYLIAQQYFLCDGTFLDNEMAVNGIATH